MKSPFEPEERSDEDLTVGRAWLDQLAATLGVSRYPLQLYPLVDAGTCDDCKHPFEQRRQYVNVQLCDPCLRLRMKTRMRLSRRDEQAAKPTENT